MQPLGVGDPQRVNRFRLVGVLGSGGMGRVFLGRAPDGAAVAVKIVHPYLVSADRGEFRDRFIREVSAAQGVDAAFTAAVVAADPYAAIPWLATEFVPGIPLGEAVTRFGPLPEDALTVLATGLLSALAALHATGLVHRDIKPSNIMLGVDGPKVIDFGIARLADATGITRTGNTIGTLGFMAPEQFERSDVGSAADVFAAGAVLAYAATGRLPFSGDTLPLLLRNLSTQPPDLDGVPSTLLPVIEAALTKDPDVRPSATAARALVPVPRTQVDPDAGWLPPAVTTAILRAAADALSTPAAEPADPAPHSTTVAETPVTPIPGTAGSDPVTLHAPRTPAPPGPLVPDDPADPDGTAPASGKPALRPDHKAVQGAGYVLLGLAVYGGTGWYAWHGDPPRGMNGGTWLLSIFFGGLGTFVGLDDLFEVFYPAKADSPGQVLTALVLAVAGFVAFALVVV
ncbi:MULTISPECIES: protein kinase [Streptomyces]|uniref:Protein kinase domain-containing protein n=1 Tax=Streptomyces luteosporeus TaxID=173856 RepID=A0ABP6G5Z7_9ACTN